MSTWTPILLKVFLLVLPLSLTGWSLFRLIRKGPTRSIRALITLVLVGLLILPLLVVLGPRLLKVTVPALQESAPLFVQMSQNLVVGTATTVAPDRAMAPTLSWQGGAILIWGMGSLAGLFLLLWGMGGVWLHLRRSIPLTAEQKEVLRRSLGSDQDYPLGRICLSDRIQGPAVAGFFRSRILIPTRLFDHLSSEELRVMVLHEWSHMQNHDAFFTLLGRLACLCYWWNPLVHLLARERERIQELIGDETAARRSGELPYAKVLLSLAEKSRQDLFLKGFLAFFGPLPLKERIERILFKEDTMNQKSWHKGVLLLGILAMGVMLAAAGTTFMREPVPSDSPRQGQKSDNVQDTPVEPPQVEGKPLRLSVRHHPRLLRRVDPEYPEEAKKNHVSGQVILELTVGTQGRVVTVKVVTGPPLLTDAAISAVEQWQYEPYRVNGNPQVVQFIVQLSFRLYQDEQPLRLSSQTRPKLIKGVAPEYPEGAQKSHVSGVVVLQVTTDIDGKVVNVRLISGHPLLTVAAISAVKQWRYEPYRVNGEPRSIRFVVPVAFKLRAEASGSPEGGASQVPGKGQQAS